MATCARCGEENPDRARFCLKCGADLAPAPSIREERKLVSVLFVDLVGFTSRSDRADPEDVRDTLQLYHSRVKEQIERYGGAVEKFIGDAVMAVFGAPLSHGDDAERAVRAGLRVLDAIEALNREQPGLELAVRAAVNTGEAVVAVGSGHELGEALAMGDVVNTASRLQGAAPQGRLIVGEETYRDTRHAILYEEHSPVRAKGKTEPVPAWIAVTPLGGPAERPAGRAPMVGRDREMGLLASIWDRAVDERRPHLVTVIGPSGIGKSRLTHEVSSLIEGKAGRVVRGRCLPYEEQAGYPAFGQVVRQVAGMFESDEPDLARQKLARTVGHLLPEEEAPGITRHLSLLLGLGTDDPVDDQMVLFFAARRFVERVALELSTLMVFDDLQWADPSQLDLLEYLASHVRDAPVVFLAVARPELLDLRAAWGSGLLGHTSIPLEPLGVADTAMMASHLLTTWAERSSAVERLVEMAEGNPLFVEELAASIAERGEGGELPGSVKAAIASRIDALPPEPRAALLTASVIGKTFWRGILRTLGGTDGIDEALDALEARDLIRREPTSQVEGDAEFTFKHILIREVAYATLPRATRRERHAAAAQYIEDAVGGGTENLAWVLAYHWREAAEPLKAVSYLIAAGDRARDAWAKEGAVELYRKAVDLYNSALQQLPEDDPRRRDLLIRRAIAYQRLDHAELDVPRPDGHE